MEIKINESKKWQNSLTLKIILLAVMGLFLLIPLGMIKSIILERQNNSEKVKLEIANQWALRQTISGPVLNIPVRIIPTKEDGEYKTRIIHIMPEKLDVSGDVKTETRHKSIYQAVVYNAGISLSGEFQVPALNTGEKEVVLWNEAYYTLGISDNRGLKGSVILKLGASEFSAVPGLKDQDVFPSGVSFPAELKETDKAIPFQLAFSLAGSGGLSFSPTGKETHVNLKSSWNAPGFIGNFLPSSREINNNGFKSDWLITNLNRNFPQLWTGNEFKPENDSFGVDFVMTVDHYQKSLRSAKYGVLFIALTFMVLLFIEMMSGEQLQIISYLLVSLALLLFFSLLNALSEHIGFNPSYLISSLATIVLITGFLGKIIRKLKPVLVITGMLVFLYSFILILLTLNDYAYLAGNIGLFFLLAVTMAVSTRLKNNRAHVPDREAVNTEQQ
jgi:inner membrane protein